MLNDIDMLERAVFAEDKRAVLRTLAPSLPFAAYLSALCDLKDSALTGDKLKEAYEKHLQEFQRAGRATTELSLRYLLRQLANTSDETKVAALLKDFNDRELHYAFEFARPQAVHAGSVAAGETKSAAGSELTAADKKLLEPEHWLSKLYATKDPELLARLSREYLRLLDLSRFSAAQNKDFARALLETMLVHENAKAPDFFLEALKLIEPAALENVFASFSVPQQERLVTHAEVQSHQPFVLKYIMSKYDLGSACDNSFRLSLPTKKEELDKLAQKLPKIIAFCEGLPKKYQRLTSSFMYYNLYVRGTQGFYDADLLLAYLKNPAALDVIFSEQTRKQLEADWQANAKEESRLTTDVPDNYLATYAKKALAKQPNAAKFQSLVNEQTLNKLFAEARLLAGEEAQNLRQIFSPAEVTELFSRKLIEFVEKKNTYMPDEKVAVKLGIKNVSKLSVKVYDVDTLNYLRDNKDADLNFAQAALNGVVPLEEYAYSYSQDPNVYHEEKFSFACVDVKPRGVYVIDFQGDELYSRAVIFKGALELVTDNRLGRRLAVMDEQGKVCVGGKTGVYIRNRFFEADANGVIALPDNLEAVSENVIITTHGFAQSALLQVLPDGFTLSPTLIFNSEELVPGKRMTLLVKNVLTDLRRASWPLSEVKDVELTVALTCQEGIEQNITQKRAALSDSGDIELSVLVPAKLYQVTATVSGKVFGRVKVSGTQRFTVMNPRDDTLVTCYHKRTAQGHIVEVLGPVGEPIEDREFVFELHSRVTDDSVKVHLVTDKHGKVNLGPLAHVRTIGVFANDASIASFSLELPQSSLIPSASYYLVGGHLRFDAAAGDYVSFWKKNSFGAYEEELTAKLARSGTEYTYTFGRPGEYELRVNQEVFGMSVKDGRLIDIFGQKILTEDEILESGDHRIPFFVDLKQTEEGLALHCSRASPNLYAHVLTFNFADQAADLLADNLRNAGGNCNPPLATLARHVQHNQFHEGGRLADEEVYIQKRKAQTKFMGNSLEKPTMLLKRKKIRDTNETERVLEGARPPLMADHAYGICRSSACPPMCPGPIAEKTITPLRFLEHPGKVFANLSFKDNELRVGKKALEGFSCGVVYVFDGNEFISKEFSLAEQPVARRDLRLKASRAQSQIYAVNRSLGYVPRGESVTIRNPNIAQFSFITDLGSLFKAFALLNKTDRASMSEWQFLAEWNALGLEQKKEKYNKYMSHELNTFCFFKDKPFFDAVVKNFLRSKREKQLIDFVLLDDQFRLKDFCNLGSLSALTKVELTLLAFAVRNTNPDFANTVKAFLRDKASLNVVTEEQEKAAFETLMQLKDQEKPDQPEPSRSGKMEMMLDSVQLRGANLDDLEEKSMERTKLEKSFAKAAPRPQNLMMMAAPARYMDTREDERARGLPREERPKKEALFRMPEKTVEYAERQYFFKSVGYKVEKFWSDACAHLVEKGSNARLFSKNLLHTCGQGAECVFALALVDLPGASEGAAYASAETTDGLLIKANADLIIAVKDVLELHAEENLNQVLVSQRFYDPSDRYVFSEDGSRVDKFVDEFVVGKIYGSQVVLTNTSSSRLDVDLAYEIPQGAVPVGGTDAFFFGQKTLNAYATGFSDFLFYFPYTGKFSVYPATAMKKGKLYGRAAATDITVNKFLTEKKAETFADVLLTGNINDIADFLQMKNILSPDIFQFDKIYWLLRDKEYYAKLLPILKRRGVFDATAYSFAALHGDLPTFLELLRNRGCDELLYSDSPLFQLDAFEFLDYYPLINSRAHSIQDTKTNILNNQFKQTYARFLLYLLQKGRLADEDLVVLCTYLIMQDRNEEAVQFFKKIAAGALGRKVRLQYDYLAAYIDFLTGFPSFAVAREKCAKYAEYPVLAVRNLFREIKNQLDEFDERDVTPESKAAQIAENAQNSALSLSLKCSLEKNCIKVISTNIKTLRVKYYRTDTELLFSLNPFKNSSASSLSWIAPFHEELVLTSPESVVGKTLTTLVRIPPAIEKDALYIEVSHDQPGFAKPCFLEYSRFELDCTLKSEFGVLQVRRPATRKPEPRVYVKCFAKLRSGASQFYKDGYTDLTGTFDYAALNSDTLADITKFALLLVSETEGSTVLQVDPPVKLGRNLDQDD